MGKKGMSYLIWILGVIAIDQLSKVAVTSWLSPHQSIPIIEPLFFFTLAKNPGGAFGILQSNGVLVMIVTAAISIGLLGALLFADLRDGLLKLGLAIIAGGALSNLLDRLRLGYVVDFLDFRVWPVFNLADFAIVVGTGLILVQLLRRARPC